MVVSFLKNCFNFIYMVDRLIKWFEANKKTIFALITSLIVALVGLNCTGCVMSEQELSKICETIEGVLVCK